MTGTMRAARWHGRGDVRVEDVPIPTVGPGEVLLRVSWCGICGTDVEEYRDGPVVIPINAPNGITGQMAPVTLGHEFAGTVVEVGPGVEGLATGDRVVPDICLFCGECHYCRRHEYALCVSWAAIGLHGDGGLAEYVKVPARMCVRLPEEIGDDEAALIETTEVAVRAVRKAGIRLGDSVAIVGDGAVGLITLQVARAAGATTALLVGHRPARLALGRQLGADAAIDSRETGWLDEVRRLTDGLGADVAIECGGRPEAIGDSIAATRKGGTIVLLAVIGVPIPVNTWPIVEGERTVVGSVQHHFDEDLPVAVRLMASGQVNVRPLISRRISLERVVEDGLAAPPSTGSDIKVLVSTRVAPGAA
ncbi:MAG: 2,3-butanediol dehydrogenase [Chloroflexi bacterium]|jgi:(R,R)-butanediol dehydrogenase/meso-butanediol dehydrogenase/diacetyl reductase|nr:2,3-butanediol dehydrogenase [Chloroflexota bacterium]